MGAQTYQGGAPGAVSKVARNVMAVGIPLASQLFSSTRTGRRVFSSKLEPWTAGAFLSVPQGSSPPFKRTPLLHARRAADMVAGRLADTVARDEDVWFNVRYAFTVDRNMINLNNGGVSPAPKIGWTLRSTTSKSRISSFLLHLERARSGSRNHSPPTPKASAAILKKLRLLVMPVKAWKPPARHGSQAR